MADECPTECQRRIEGLEVHKEDVVNPNTGVVAKIRDRIDKVKDEFAKCIKKCHEDREDEDVVLHGRINDVNKRFDTKVGNWVFRTFAGVLILMGGYGFLFGASRIKVDHIEQEQHKIEVKQQTIFTKQEALIKNQEVIITTVNQMAKTVEAIAVKLQVVKDDNGE